jgi:hypothetical protein
MFSQILNLTRLILWFQLATLPPTREQALGSLNVERIPINIQFEIFEPQGIKICGGETNFVPVFSSSCLRAPSSGPQGSASIFPEYISVFQHSNGTA